MVEELDPVHGLPSHLAEEQSHSARRRPVRLRPRSRLPPPPPADPRRRGQWSPALVARTGGCQPRCGPCRPRSGCPPPPRRPPTPPSCCLREQGRSRASPPAGSSDTTPGRPSGPGSWATTPAGKIIVRRQHRPIGHRLGSPPVGTKKIPELLATSTPTRSALGAIVVGVSAGRGHRGGGDRAVGGGRRRRSGRCLRSRRSSRLTRRGQRRSPHRPPAPPSRPRDLSRTMVQRNLTWGRFPLARPRRSSLRRRHQRKLASHRSSAGFGLSEKRQYPPTGSAGSVTRSNVASPDSSIMIGRLVTYP